MYVADSTSSIFMNVENVVPGIVFNAFNLIKMEGADLKIKGKKILEHINVISKCIWSCSKL